MPSFHEVRLPEEVERGAVGGPQFKTRVLQLDSGFEQRNVDWSQARGEWDIGYGVMDMDDDDAVICIKQILHFFYARQGRAYGFRFKDWSDYRLGDYDNPTDTYQTIGLGDGTTTQFQIFKTYSSGGVDYNRPLKKIVNGTVKVLLDGVVQPAGWSVDVNTGIVTFTSAPSATGGTAPGGEVVIGVVCEFDVPVRFDTDQLKINVQLVTAGQIPSIPVVELRLR